MLGEETLYQSISELAPQIRARKISPVELTESFLVRIRRYGEKLGAIATVLPDSARREARQAESEIAANRYRGPLHGIPYLAKDLFAVAGTTTTWGAAPCRDQKFTQDATVIVKLREAGGSSSGSGSAVAAGLCAFALGTETWGSILCPSAFNGVTGLRPTYGRVSRFGGMVGSWTFDKVGPLARTAADCRLVLRAISGEDPLDPSSANEPPPPELTRKRPQQIRAALFPLDFTKYGEAEVKRAFDQSVADLDALGVRPETVKLPDLPFSEAAGVIITAEALSTFEKFYRDGSVKTLSDPYAAHQPDINREMTGADLVKAWRIRHELQERMSEFFTRYDVIVSPNFMSVAPPIERDLYETLPYPDPLGGVGNACGLPAVALPNGFGRDHCPTSFQIVGAPFDEGTVLDLAEAYQRRTRWHRERPPLR